MAAGNGAPSPWHSLRNGVFLGDEHFVASNLDRTAIKNKVLEVPREQTRRRCKTISEWETNTDNRDDAIIGAYLSGAYTLREIGDYFNLHYSRISRIVSGRKIEKAKGKT